MANDESKKVSTVKYVPTKDGELKPESSEKKPDTLFLYYTMIAGYFMALGGATTFTWSSPVIPKLLSNDTSINPLKEPVTTVEISMMMGLPGLTSLCGTLIAPLVSDMIGRKKLLLFTSMAMILCLTMIAYSSRMVYIIIGRCIFIAVFMGGTTSLLIYILEVCETHNRAKFGCLLGIFMPLGCLYSYIVGPIFSFRTFTLFTSLPLFISIFLLSFIYESPVYLLSKGRKEECLKVLRKLRSNKTERDIQIDFEEIEHNLKQRLSAENATIPSLFKTKQGRVGMLLAIIPSFFQYASGAPVLVGFLGPIFSEADIGISGNNIAIIMGIIKVLTISITVTIIERFTRKTLLIFSSTGCGLTLFIIGLYFYLQHIKSPILPSIKLLPLISTICYFILFAMGLGPIPPTFAGELFTSEFRSVAMSVIATFMGFLMFFVTFGFPLLAEYAGLHWVFWIFCICSFIGTITIYCLVIETRGKSISEIQEELINYRFSLKRQK